MNFEHSIINIIVKRWQILRTSVFVRKMYSDVRTWRNYWRWLHRPNRRWLYRTCERQWRWFLSLCHTLLWIQGIKFLRAIIYRYIRRRIRPSWGINSSSQRSNRPLPLPLDNIQLLPLSSWINAFSSGILSIIGTTVQHLCFYLFLALIYLF
jgi:hypothetical protein